MQTTTIVQILPETSEKQHVIELPSSVRYTKHTEKLGTAVLDETAHVKGKKYEDPITIEIYNDYVGHHGADYQVPAETNLYFFGKNAATEDTMRSIRQNSKLIPQQTAAIWDQLLIDGRQLIEGIDEICKWYFPWNDRANDRVKAKAFEIEQFVRRDLKKPSMFSSSEYKESYTQWISDLYRACFTLEKTQSNAPFFEMPEELQSKYLGYRAWNSNWYKHERVCELLNCYSEAHTRVTERHMSDDDHYWLYSSVSLCTKDEFVDVNSYWNYYYSKRI